MKSGWGLLAALLLTACTSWEEESQFRVEPKRTQAAAGSVDATLSRIQYRFAESLPATHPRVRDKRRFVRSRYPSVTVFSLADGGLFFQLWDAGEGPFQQKSPYFHQAEEMLLQSLSQTYGRENVTKIEFEGVPR